MAPGVVDEVVNKQVTPQSFRLPDRMAIWIRESGGIVDLKRDGEGMVKKAILFIDLLGVQKMWRHGGAQAVKARIEAFNDFVTSQASFLPHELHREGEYTVVLSGDSASILCQDVEQAIGIGTHFFVQAFYQTKDMKSDPFWLRGAISQWHNQYLTLNSVPRAYLRTWFC
jgi:hypothetical protein